MPHARVHTIDATRHVVARPTQGLPASPHQSLGEYGMGPWLLGMEHEQLLARQTSDQDRMGVTPVWNAARTEPHGIQR